MVIGSLKAARGFFAAHSRCTTETIANCSCAHTYSCSATPDRKQSRRPCSGPWLRRPRPRNGSTARPMSGEPQRQTENLHALRFGCSRCGEVRLFDQVLVFSHSHSSTRLLGFQCSVALDTFATLPRPRSGILHSLSPGSQHRSRQPGDCPASSLK